MQFKAHLKTGLLGAVLGVVAVTGFTTYAETREQQPILSSPGKHVLAEQAFGIRDGLARVGTEISPETASRLDRIAEERVPDVATVLRPIYDTAYTQTIEGRWTENSLDFYLGIIEMETDAISFARDLADNAAAKHWGMDAIDTMILSSYTEATTAIVLAGGEEQKQIFSDLFMMEIAHDQLRDAFFAFTDGSVNPDISPESLEGFLKATGIVPEDEQWAVPAIGDLHAVSQSASFDF